LFALCACATGRTYESDRFALKVADDTRVKEERRTDRSEWSFFDAGGSQFLGASVYSIAGDPTIACGIPRSDRNGAPAFLIRRTLRSRRVVTLLFPQDDGTVLDFSYDESEERAHTMVASVSVRRPLHERFRCETLRSGAQMSGDTYDAGPFTARLLPGTWLLDFGRFRPRSERGLGGDWVFEEAATGTPFLRVSWDWTDVSPLCPAGRPIDVNGTTAFRSTDTDNLEPYPGPSNVKLTFLKRIEGQEIELNFSYDEHSPTAHLAEKTIASLRVPDVALVSPDCHR